ncbi:AMP-binding protein [Streptomyces sp. NPDC050549]|uniref:AMP-binding protein n=1 Tax=Streptomyces sp. NPDC050549 TaxID=3155406 RepID=UPI0034139F50
MHNFASILDYHLAQRPEAVAVVQDESSLTVRQLHERVNELAAGLAGLGVGRGDVVGLLLYNQPEFLELVYATNRLGAVFLPLNYRLSEEEWQYILGHAQAKVIVTEPEFVRAVERSAGCLTDLEHRVLIGGDELPEEPWTGYEELLARHKGERVEPVDVELGDLQRLMYTSGTTSRPKGVRITYGNLEAKNLAHIVHFGLTAADTTLVCGPLYHVGGLDMPALGVLHAGGSVVLQRKAGRSITWVDWTCRPSGSSTRAGVSYSSGSSIRRESWTRSRSTGSPMSGWRPPWSTRCLRCPTGRSTTPARCASSSAVARRLPNRCCGPS